MGKLTAKQVAKLTKPGFYADGDGLYLSVGKGRAKSWQYRYGLHGKSHYLGLGSASAISLKRARELVVEPRRLRAEGIDPMEHRRAERVRAKSISHKVTFREAADRYISAHEHAWKSQKYRTQYRAALEADVYPILGGLLVAEIDTAAVLKVLQPIWGHKPQTANRLRGRIEQVLDAAKSADLRTGDNPARWRGHLENLLAAPRKLRKVTHMPAMPYSEAPEFMRGLRGSQNISARALEVTILTAARTAEVLGARWNEIDFQNNVWTIPANRMKAGKEHRIPLSPRAIDILRELSSRRESEWVFPSYRAGQPLSPTSMLKALQLANGGKLTVHGFRSTFRDWAAEQTDCAREVVEMALAHTIGNAVEVAYRRGDLFEKRRKLMADWSTYVSAYLKRCHNT
jgi:integrase